MEARVLANDADNGLEGVREFSTELEAEMKVGEIIVLFRFFPRPLPVDVLVVKEVSNELSPDIPRMNFFHSLLACIENKH